MSKGIIGKKIGMTTMFADDGSAVPVTVVEAAPNLVFGHRTQERDGYTALQLGFDELDEKKAERRQTKPYLGQFKRRISATSRSAPRSPSPCSRRATGSTSQAPPAALALPGW